MRLPDTQHDKHFVVSTQIISSSGEQKQMSKSCMSKLNRIYTLDLSVTYVMDNVMQMFCSLKIRNSDLYKFYFRKGVAITEPGFL